MPFVIVACTFSDNLVYEIKLMHTQWKRNALDVSVIPMGVYQVQKIIVLENIFILMQYLFISVMPYMT